MDCSGQQVKFLCKVNQLRVQEYKYCLVHTAEKCRLPVSLHHQCELTLSCLLDLTTVQKLSVAFVFEIELLASTFVPPNKLALL
jgi:hypothetical protein